MYDDEYITTGELNEIIEQERHDADMEQAEFERQGRELARLRRQGICTHGWLLGRGSMDRTREEIDEDRQRGDFPDRSTDPSITKQSDIPDGMCLCLNCGTIVEDPCP